MDERVQQSLAPEAPARQQEGNDHSGRGTRQHRAERDAQAQPYRNELLGTQQRHAAGLARRWPGIDADAWLDDISIGILRGPRLSERPEGFNSRRAMLDA